jgi:hypothetical protein
MTQRAQVIVCERSGHWAVGLREVLPDGFPLWETRSLVQCLKALAHSPQSFVVVELTDSNTQGLLRCLAQVEQDYPQARLAVVGDRGVAGREWLMREAGAVHVTCSPRQLAALADIARRHLARIVPAQQPLTDRLWAELPWKGQR